ncbi:restriction endonuclease subunit S [Pseudidiomarina sp.]|uniref:restriction endonuclease subunit S n=1 Tax=Pseudidiomarina sp. TaxID=2081707 RepID=UPI003A97D118
MTSEWTLEALGQIVTGKTPPKSIKNAYSDSGVPFVTPKDMDGRKWTVTTERSLSHEGVRSVQKSVVPAGSVAVSCIGSDMGKAVRIPVDSVTNQQINTLIPDTEKCDPDYLYYLLSTMQQDLKDIAGGSATPILNKGHFGKVRVRLPAIWYQKQAAKILSALDDKIQVNHQINQTLEQMAQAIFKSWFVDFEPVKAKIATLEAGGSEEDALLAAMQAISGKSEAELARLQAEQPEQYAELRATAGLFPAAMQDSELGEIPEGWECMALDQIAKYQNGLALQKFRPENEDDYLPVVKIAQLKKGYADHDEKASPDIKPDCIIDNGDVVFSWSGSLMVDTWCGGKAALNQHLFKVTSESYPKWLYFHFTRHHLEEFQRIAADKAVTMGHIKREHLKRALCAIPNKTAIENAGKILERVLSKQIELRLEKITLSELRDTLLPKLLSGELVLDAQLEEKGVVNV